MKILGTIIQGNLRLVKEIGKTTSILHNRINNIHLITPYTTFETRLNFFIAFVLGKLNYMLPIYSLAININYNKLHKIITTAARCAIGSYCFKKSIVYILKKV